QGEHGGLPRAVRPDERDELPARGGEGDAPQQLRAVDREPDGLDPHARLPRAHPCTARDRITSIRKNGAPISAVNSPIGTSAGGATMRERVSATTISSAPITAETGSRLRCA